MSENNSNNNLAFIDGLRGLLACYVLIGHARSFLWEGFSRGYLVHPEKYNFFSKMIVYFFSLFKFGHAAVIFFFVLSGFIIHFVYSDSNNWFVYLKNRFKRIYPPFIISILITLSFDCLGKTINLETCNIEGSANYTNFSYTVKTVIGNLFMLHGTYVPEYGSNGLLWSLKYEWWFYMFYPAIILLAKRSILYSSIMIFSFYVLRLLNVDLMIDLFNDLFSMFSIWWLGVLLSHYYMKNNMGTIKHFRILILFIVPSILFNEKQDRILYDFFWGLSCVGILSFLLFLNKSSIFVTVLNSLKALGEMSYTLYLTHFPILVFLSRLVIYKFEVLPLHFWFVCLGSVFCILFAYILHFISEVPFRKKHYT